MIAKLDWLPPILSLSGRPWKEIISLLYVVFERDFKQGRPKFQKYPVWWNRKVEHEGCYEEGFWHLISIEDKSTGERLIEFRRAERLPWCSPTIVHSDDDAVKVWDYMEGSGKIHTYVWLEEGDYCIVLEKIKRKATKAVMLLTAFYVDGPSRRRNLQKKLDEKEA